MSENPSLDGSHADSEASAKAKLEADVERLEAILSAERFCIVVTLIVFFDSYIFTFFKTWGSPICLTALEIAGLSVLARHMKVSDLGELIFGIVHAWRGAKDADHK